MLLLDLLRLNGTAFRHACHGRSSTVLIGVFLLAAGFSYGAATTYAQRTLGGAIQGIPLERIPDTILLAGNVLSGILIALIVHGGVTLVAWLMARGVGGEAHILFLYRATAYLMLFAAAAAPFAAIASVAGPDGLARIPNLEGWIALCAAGCALFLAGLYQIFRVTQDLSPLRAAIGTAAFALFSGSILLFMA